ncbi:C-C chemokine receptor type 6a [Synchiropus splendidus]|uniref:C-C chemokine receptor type 6a n=1 Tax=Synchiropus splendidus TaxID=270530 RepID=UPI00237E6CF1|nr:C-C chemokine receptor type 6a [Synchiropus splendidus]
MNDTLLDDCEESVTLGLHQQGPGQSVVAAVHGLICLLGLVGNGLVVATYALYRESKTMTDIFLLNVALADLLFVATLPLLVHSELSSWTAGQLTCKLVRGGYSVGLFSGTLLLACVSADRYVAIVLLRRSALLRSGRRSCVVCAGVWALSLLLSVPTFLYYHRYVPSHADSGAHYICEFLFPDENVARRAKVAVPSVQLVAGFFLPLLLMLFCYSAVVLTLQRTRSSQRHRALWLVLAVVVVFVVCHLPYNLLLLYDTVSLPLTLECHTLELLQIARTLTQTLAYLHCCLNPFLYAFMGVRFRGHFRRIVQDLWTRTKPRQSAGGSGAGRLPSADRCSATGMSLIL